MQGKISRTMLTAGLILWSVVAASGDGAAQVVRAGPPTCKAIALTFDMCPVREGSGYDAPLIAALIEQRIPATFFLSGRWMATHDAEVRALLAVPFFEVGTHGQVHAHLPMLDEAKQRAEISGPVEVLRTRYGYATALFRPPYGEFNDATVDAVRALELRFILWNALSGDPDPRLSTEQMLAHLTSTVRNGSVIVFHANGKGHHTREVVEDLYRELVVKRDLKPVTVTELLDGCEQEPRR
ncbi:MAG: polysaccharide deacetylase family protein [Nitrospirae bacterium]|nr:polysaccharide deacetylase family protein [Nitrospirota bacterium]